MATIIDSLHVLAQIAGAIVGFGGAVVVFKIEMISKSKYNYRNRVIEHVLSVHNDEDPTKYYDLEDQAIIKLFEEKKEEILDSNRREVKSEKVARHLKELNSNSLIQIKPYDFITGSYQTFNKVLKDRESIIKKIIPAFILLLSTVVLDLVLPLHTNVWANLYGALVISIFFLLSAVIFFLNALLAELTEN